MIIQKLARIFLADDDEDDCILFQDALNEIGRKNELVISKDGVELMNTLNEKVPPPPQVLFLDLNMPRKSGFECLKEIKEEEKFKDIPVVVFSTSRDKSYMDKTFQDGANFYALKPASFEELKKLIEEVLSIDFINSPRTLDTYLIRVK
jgi:CheY-like chemotaxis protein